MDHLWDCDLLVLNGERFKRANDGFAYILVTIDVFSRYCRAEPVKSKGGKHVSQGFKKIFDSLETESETEADAETVVEAVAGEMRPQLAIPRFIRSDRGTEFTNAQVTSFMREKGVKLIYTNTETKANYAEVIIKGLKKRLFQFFQRSNSYAYTEVFQDIVSAYNRTVHSKEFFSLIRRTVFWRSLYSESEKIF